MRATPSPNTPTPSGAAAAAAVHTPDAAHQALAAKDHVLGDPHAAVTLVEYGDYACPACIQTEPLVRELVREGGKALCLVFRHYPLIEVHPHAELAAEAAEAAAAQGRFWPMHERLWMAPHTLDAQALMAHAAAIGLDMVRFQADMADHLYTQRVQEHRRAGDASGVRATPTFFVNGRPVDVSFGPEHLAATVRAALGRAA